MTPEERLWQAASNGDRKTLEAALKAGIDVNAKDRRHHMTSLHYAAISGHLDIVATLIAHGADVNVKTTRQQTPLYLAVLHGHGDIAKALINGGADVNAKGLYQKTPLHVAAHAGLLAIVQMLLDNGADAEAKDADHQYTAGQYARDSGRAAIAELLTQAERRQKFVKGVTDGGCDRGIG